MGWKNCLKNNTKLEKILILFVVLLCAVVLVLFITLLSSAHDPGICDNPECVRAATHILDTVDPDVDPCNDFYQFACGTFLKNAFSLGQPSTLHHLRILMKNQLKELVLEKNEKRNISRALLMQRKFYRNCINDTLIEEDNDKTLLKLLDEAVGGWPVVKSYFWVERDFNWTKTMVKARRLGLFYQFYFRVGIYYGENNLKNIWIKPPSVKDVPSFHWNNENLELMSQIASDLGAQSVGKTRELRRTLDFADQLNLIAQKFYNTTNENEFKGINRNITINKLDHGFIKINWLDFLKNITDVAITEEDEVIFDADEYFRDLYFLLQKTPKKIQANYIAWAIISTNIHYMTEKIRSKYKKMRHAANHTESTLSRSDICYKISTDLFKYAEEGEYVRRYTPPSKREYIKGMIANIKIELKSVLEETAWMDEESKVYAVQYLQNITEEIGWTELVYDARKFENLFGYNHLRMTSDKLVDMARLVAINGVNRYYRQLKQTGPHEEEEYINTPKLDVNAFYLKFFDKLILPTPILQGLVFDERRPHYMNYGSLGSIIGHEFMHGFIEFSDHKRDGFGNSWSTNITSQLFKNASQCIIDDYNEYSKISGLDNNGTVFEENIADFSGVNLAYTAYRKWIRKHSLEDKLPGVKYTPNQLFWIMTSTYLCQEPKLSEKDESKRDPIHATPAYRVIGRLQNSPYFAKDFDCPIGSPMNPREKCRIFA